MFPGLIENHLRNKKCEARAHARRPRERERDKNAGAAGAEGIRLRNYGYVKRRGAGGGGGSSRSVYLCVSMYEGKFSSLPGILERAGGSSGIRVGRRGTETVFLRDILFRWQYIYMYSLSFERGGRGRGGMGLNGARLE